MCCANMRTLSLIVGWLHLVFAMGLSISILIYLCAYHNKTYDDTLIQEEISETGLPTLIFILMFSVASLIFDVLLLKGISEDRVKLMSPFVYGNYVAMGIQACLTIYNLIKDLIDAATFGDILIHLIGNSVTFGLLVFFFYPIYQLYHQMRCYNEQPEHRRFDHNVPADKPIPAETEGMYVN